MGRCVNDGCLEGSVVYMVPRGHFFGQVISREFPDIPLEKNLVNNVSHKRIPVVSRISRPGPVSHSGLSPGFIN